MSVRACHRHLTEPLLGAALCWSRGCHGEQADAFRPLGAFRPEEDAGDKTVIEKCTVKSRQLRDRRKPAEPHEREWHKGSNTNPERGFLLRGIVVELRREG